MWSARRRRRARKLMALHFLKDARRCNQGLRHHWLATSKIVPGLYGPSRRWVCSHCTSAIKAWPREEPPAVPGSDTHSWGNVDPWQG